MASKDNGITALNPPKGTDLSLVVIFLTLALYSVTELIFVIPTTFKRRGGQYFWFFVLATWSIVPYSVGFMLKGLAVLPQAIYLWVVFCYMGWVGMVLFQSLVMWSRLHLIVNSPRRLRLILYMIIFDAIICDVPVAVLAFGSNSPHPEHFVSIYAFWESMHVTIFALQELIISGVYVWETSKLLRIGRDNGATFNLPARSKVLRHLIYVNIIVVVLDVPTLAMYRPASTLPIFGGSSRPVGAAATSTSGPTTLNSRCDPLRSPSTLHSPRPPGSLRWLSRRYGRNAELDATGTGPSIILPKVEDGAGEAVRAI
ncbi:hypothetical protein GGTG_03450 [Gaeumannomyces tritici R3-111a-1]|uniref:DUF7703 domain-containing protein n=1 Tax=Gaeumannomyces tritici (strain R3-111a-1) TaxID=644352 RepID=J3NQ93_GAET3|nr:hypothetical protein GGTG_03450 [Gaeumannomyces tritici R3-111a-1]EJT78349.1 hypothetical protein GGTG_03450 [Gaeumannomyces tritici R3-111a-1]